MQRTLLFEVLKSFNSSNYRSWISFVRADYHVQNKRVRALANHIAKYVPRWEHGALNKASAWEKIYPGETYQETKFNNDISDLLQATYHFLEIEQLKSRSDLKFELLQTELLDRNLLKPARRIQKKWEQSQKGKQGLNAIKARYQIAHFEDLLGLMSSRRHHIAALQDKSKYLDQYYALQQLMNYCNMLSRQAIVQGQYQLPYLEALLDRYNADEQDLKGQVAIAIYVALAKLLQAESQLADFEELEALLHTHKSALNKEERKTIYNFLLNYCVRQINKGQTQFYQQVFDIYQQQLAEDLLLQDGRLSQWAYTNIITTGSRLKAWEWTEAFISDYKSRLPPKDQYNAYHYNLCTLRYEKGEDDAALRGLHQVEFTDAFYQLAAKTIQLKIYFRQNEGEAFHALLFASRQFVTRNRQLSTIKKNAYLNFLKLARRLWDLSVQKAYWNEEKWQHRKEQLQSRLDNPAYSANNKDWIKEELLKTV